MQQTWRCQLCNLPGHCVDSAPQSSTTATAFEPLPLKAHLGFQSNFLNSEPDDIQLLYGHILILNTAY